MKKENLHIGQIYNADENALFWRSLLRNTQAFKNDDRIPGKQIGKDKFSALLGANSSGTHRFKPVIVEKAAKPGALKDCLHELPDVCYNRKNTLFSCPIQSD